MCLTSLFFLLLCDPIEGRISMHAITLLNDKVVKLQIYTWFAQ